MKKIVRMTQKDLDYLLDKLSAILHDNVCSENTDAICDSLCKYIEVKNPERRLEKFNLAEAEAGNPVYTRNGRKARIICFNRACTNLSDRSKVIVALTESPDGNEEINTYDREGRIFPKEEDGLDLMSVSENEEDNIWVARDKNGWLCAFKEKPVKMKSKGIWKCPPCTDISFMQLDKDMFPYVKWEDEEPCKLVLR